MRGLSWYNKSATVRLTLKGAALGTSVADTGVSLLMINSTCANPKAMWLASMNSVAWPDAGQLEQLRAASRVCEEKIPIQKGVGASENDNFSIEVTLEAYAAAEVIIPGHKAL